MGGEAKVGRAGTVPAGAHTHFLSDGIYRCVDPASRLVGASHSHHHVGCRCSKV